MKMKKLLPLIGICSLILVWGFKAKQLPAPSAPNTSVAQSDLQGTWVLITEKRGEEMNMRPPQRGHIKHKLINGKHFSWAEYTEEGELVAMAGGTYQLTGSTYTENIEYCFPKGSNLLGVSIPFTHSFQDGMWLHSGFLQERELDGETGEYVVKETYKISEVWERIKN